MNGLLALSRGIDFINDRAAILAKWAVLASCFISALNAIVRYVFNYSSNSYLEIQWYLFAVCVMLGAAQVLRVNEHVRVDVLYGMYSGRTQARIDLFGLVFFLVPVMLAMIYYSWPVFIRMYESGEMSGNSGGLIRWPVKLLIPLGFVLLALQGVSEMIKRAAALLGNELHLTEYERPVQ